MANQPEVAVYESGIYQFETTDVVEGGVGGIDNRPLLELANRTKWLKGQTDDINKLVPKRRFSFTGLNIGTTVGTLTSSGDVVSVISTGASSQQTILNITIPAMPNMNYLPKIYLEATNSPFSLNNHSKVFAPSVIVLGTSVFSVIFGKGDSLPTNFTVKCEVVSLD